MISEFSCEDVPNTYSGYVLVHDSARSIHLRLTGVPDEAVPKLSLFAELDLVGMISGEGICRGKGKLTKYSIIDDCLEMSVSWDHAAFHNDQVTTPCNSISIIVLQAQKPGSSGAASAKASVCDESRTAKRQGTEHHATEKHCSKARTITIYLLKGRFIGTVSQGARSHRARGRSGGRPWQGEDGGGCLADHDHRVAQAKNDHQYSSSAWRRFRPKGARSAWSGQEQACSRTEPRCAGDRHYHRRDRHRKLFNIGGAG